MLKSWSIINTQVRRRRFGGNRNYKYQQFYIDGLICDIATFIRHRLDCLVCNLAAIRANVYNKALTKILRIKHFTCIQANTYSRVDRNVEIKWQQKIPFM